MKLYIVTNGYIGNDYVYCCVIANSADEAKTLASEKLKKEADEHGYKEDYYTKLEAEEVLDASKPGSTASMGG